MNPKDKATLKLLIKEKATRQYFMEKMRQRLSKAWQAGQLENKLNIATKKRYQAFENKIDKIDYTILKIVPPGTHNDYVRFRTVD